MTIRSVGFDALAAVLVAALFGCGGGVKSVGGEGDGGASGTTTTDTGTHSGTGNATGTATPSGGQQCGPDAIDANDPCEVCVGNACTAEALACCEQPGCLDIIACAKEKQCTGFDCYKPETCQAEIDAAGGPAVALEFASPLGDCATAQCATECGAPGGTG